ncbi:HxlR family transcriptional regulator [Rhizobium sp. BK251]|nr:HxlR family transcriptional regulator [Rhizobium sp. BK251]
MAMTDTVDDHTACPVARSQEIVGDRWTIVILRELFMGSHRFEEIQAQTGATPQMLAARLKRLEADQMIERRPYSQRPLRNEYHLTEKGQAFYPVILALRAWGEHWCKSPEEGPAVTYIHKLCGKDPGFGPVCEACGEPMRREELQPQMSAEYAAERERRHRLFKEQGATRQTGDG